MTSQRAPKSISTAWVIVFALVFASMILSMLKLMAADHLPARFIDVGRSTLTETADGTRLTLVLRHAPRHGQVEHTVIGPDDEGLVIVEVRLSATGTPAPREDEDDRRTLAIDLPDVRRVRVVDLRWGRDEAVVIER